MKKIWLFLVGIILLAGMLFTIGRDFYTLRAFIDDKVYDRKILYIPCYDLPAEKDARDIVKLHQGIVQEIKEVNPESIEFEVYKKDGCPGKAYIAIFYPGHNDRVKIEKILSAETFFGVPYQFINY